MYQALVTIANVPVHDKFQVVSSHAADELIYPADGFLGLTYSPDIVSIQMTWNAGRTVAIEQALYRALADGIHTAARIRNEDVIISLVDVPRENCSLGGGEMTFAPM